MPARDPPSSCTGTAGILQESPCQIGMDSRAAAGILSACAPLPTPIHPCPPTPTTRPKAPCCQTPSTWSSACSWRSPCPRSSAENAESRAGTSSSAARSWSAPSPKPLDQNLTCSRTSSAPGRSSRRSRRRRLGPAGAITVHPVRDGPRAPRPRPGREQNKKARSIVTGVTQGAALPAQRLGSSTGAAAGADCTAAHFKEIFRRARSQGAHPRRRRPLPAPARGGQSSPSRGGLLRLGIRAEMAALVRAVIGRPRHLTEKNRAWSGWVLPTAARAGPNSPAACGDHTGEPQRRSIPMDLIARFSAILNRTIPDDPNRQDLIEAAISHLATVVNCSADAGSSSTRSAWSCAASRPTRWRRT